MASLPPSARKSLLRAILRTDAVLIRVSRLFSTPRGTDITLQTSQYLLSLVRLLLQRRLNAQLQLLATSIADSASAALLPGETLLADIPVSPVLGTLARSLRATKNAEELIGDYRVFVRLWGLLGVYTWGRSLLVEGVAPRDKTLRWIEYAQVAANAVFQALENTAYLAQKGILLGEGWEGEKSVARQTHLWLWSSRFWAAHVGLELLRLVRLRNMRQKEIQQRVQDGESIKIKERERVWRQNLIVNAAYAPMTLHWSFEEGLFSEASIGLCGSLVGLIGFRNLWNSTAD